MVNATKKKVGVISRWFIVIVLSIVAWVDLGSLAWSRNKLAHDAYRYMVVGSHSAMPRLAFVAAAGDEAGVKLISDKEPFAQQIAATVGHPHSGEFGVYRFVGRMLDRELPSESGLETVRSRTALWRTAHRAWAIPAACLLGLVFGFLLPVSGRGLTPLFASLTALCLVKLATSCPTCPTASLFGIDPALLGLLVFGLATPLATLASGERRRLLASSLGGAALVQIGLSYGLEAICVPCTAIAALCGYACGSSVSPGAQFDRSVGSPANRLRLAATVGAWALAMLLPGAVWLSVGSKGSVALPLVNEAARSRLIKPTEIKNIRELGLKPTGVPTVFYVAHAGCPPCMEGLRLLDAGGVTRIRFVYVDNDKPDRKRYWARIPNSAPITMTPMVLFVSESGDVVHIVPEVPQEETEFADFVAQVERHTSISSHVAGPRPPRGGTRSKGNGGDNP